MSAKPSIADTRFGVDGSNADASNIVAPTSGARDTAWTLNQVPTSSVHNYLHNRYYRWFQFIDEVFKVAGTAIGDFTLSGTVTSGGALAVGGLPLVVGSTTFTADNTTEIFTATGINLQTGDGPLRVSNSGGALPTGIVAATDYWAIRLTANTYQLATSFANAVAGTFLLISTNGTGTNSIVSTGSTTRAADAAVSRNLTVAGNETVGGSLAATGLITANAGVTVAATQHVTVSGTGDFKHGSKTLVIPASAAATPPVAGSTWTFISDNRHWTASNSGDLLGWPLLIQSGRRIVQLDFWFQRAGGTMSFQFLRAPLSTNTAVSLASTTVAAGTSLTSVSLTGINYVLLATEQYDLRVVAGATGDQAFAVVVTFDNP